MRLVTRSLILAVVWLLGAAMNAQAGGWAVITLDDLPKQITAGQALTIGFTVRQHGKTLRSDLRPIVRFDRTDAKESFEATAQRQGGEGHYAAEIKFPSAGQWNWHVDIEQFGMITQPMPTLSVQAAQAVAPTKAVPAKTLLPPLAAILDVVRAINRMLAREAGATPAPALSAPVNLAAMKAIQVDQAALGKELFVAKGCVMCHTHALVKNDQGTFWIGEQPPDLTNVKLNADYLRQWLKDPSALKPNTAMPTLGLKSDEIEALIAFLKANSQ